jgi:hypothetical protein
MTLEAFMMEVSASMVTRSLLIQSLTGMTDLLVKSSKLKVQGSKLKNLEL